MYVHIHCIFGDSQAKITVCTPYIYGSGQPYTFCVSCLKIRVGQNHIYTVYIRYFGREITKYSVIYGVNIRFWPTLLKIERGVCRVGHNHNHNHIQYIYGVFWQANY
jgi:hypothetical protein